MGVPDIGGVDANQPVSTAAVIATQVDDVGVGRIDGQGEVVVALARRRSNSPRIGNRAG